MLGFGRINLEIYRATHQHACFGYVYIDLQCQFKLELEPEIRNSRNQHIAIICSYITSLHCNVQELLAHPYANNLDSSFLQFCITNRESNYYLERVLSSLDSFDEPLLGLFEVDHVPDRVQVLCVSVSSRSDEKHERL